MGVAYSMYACGPHLLEMSFVCRVHSFAFVNVCVCVHPPSPFSSGVITSRRTLWWSGLAPGGGPKSPLLSFPPCTPLYLPPFVCSFPPLQTSHSFFHRSSLPPLSFHSSLKSFLSSLPTSINPSSVIPVVFPLLSWQILVIPDSPQGRTGVFQTFPPQASLPKPLSTEKHAAGKYKSLDNRE